MTYIPRRIIRLPHPSNYLWEAVKFAGWCCLIGVTVSAFGWAAYWIIETAKPMILNR